MPATFAITDIDMFYKLYLHTLIRQNRSQTIYMRTISLCKRTLKYNLFAITLGKMT